MKIRRFDSRLGRRRAALWALALFSPVALVASAVSLAAPGRNSAATITGTFGDSCRDFAAHSSKDISHVEIHYADGRVVKDERIESPNHAIDGDAGDEIEFVKVKSGRTTETFACPRTNGPPTAVLEVKTPENCFTWADGQVDCDGRTARTTWTHSTTALGYGVVSFFCGWPDDQSCVEHAMPCGQLDFYSLCRLTYTYRGASSTDPDDDIVSWSIDFGDGASASGDWATNPPTEVSHEYLTHHCPTCTRDPATLTVTDSAGNSDSDAHLPLHEYPD
jgi:hypothetical protein